MALIESTPPWSLRPTTTGFPASLLLLCLSVVTACSPYEPPWERSLSQGRECFAEGQKEEALAHYEDALDQAIEFDPDGQRIPEVQVEIHGKLAEQALAKRRLREAESHGHRACFLALESEVDSPSLIETLRRIGQRRFHAGEFERAVTNLGAAHELAERSDDFDPTDRLILLRELASTLIQQGELARAEQVLRGGLELCAERSFEAVDVELARTLAAVLGRRGDLAGASRLLNDSMKRAIDAFDPTHPALKRLRSDLRALRSARSPIRPPDAPGPRRPQRTTGGTSP